jgi:hypothetical protein
LQKILKGILYTDEETVTHMRVSEITDFIKIDEPIRIRKESNIQLDNPANF